MVIRARSKSVSAPRAGLSGCLGALLCACAATHAAGADLRGPLREGETGFAVRCAKVFTMDEKDHIYAPGMVLVRNGKIVAAGELEPVPEGFEVIDFADGWAIPGMVDLHSHIQSGGFGDVNDMVLPVNPEFRSSPAIVPGNRLIRIACASGVTTLFGIPGSGTSISGAGVLYKTKLSGGYERAVLADPGGLKVAQDSNPQRGAGDLGASRAGLSWMLEHINNEAKAAVAQHRFDFRLETLKKVHEKKLPVIIHTAGSDGVTNTARMWRGKYDTRSVLTHGCFDAWKTSRFVTHLRMPINNGPRTMEYQSSREGREIGIVDEWMKSGATLISLNTDSPVVPEEELFLQGSMSSRLGADAYVMLRALTIHPAKAFGIDGRVGSLEPGKDADIVIRAGDPLDPRAAVERVWIDGRIEYDRQRDGQVF
jgi:imidazolonepropionase-like amidohydrolase